MSVESMAIALHHSRAKGTAKIVLIGIANHDGDGGAWPSVQTLAKYANVDPRNVQQALKSLVSLGEIRREENQGGSADTPEHLRPNLYRFLLECPAYCDRSRQHRDTRPTARYTPRYLDFDPVTKSSPGDEIITPPVTKSSPHPVTKSSPELVIKKPAIEHRALDLTAGARADDEVRSAPSPSESPVVRPACPKRRFMPCAYNAEHVCIDCGGIDPQHIDPTTGEVA